MATSDSPIRRGYDPRKEVSGGSWLKIEANATIDIIPLIEAIEIISCEHCTLWLDEGRSPSWIFTGKNDPSIPLNVDRGHKAFLPVVVDNEVKVWQMSKTVHNMILDLSENLDDRLKGQIIRVRRTGTGRQTKYTLTPRGKMKDVSGFDEVDVVSMLGPVTSDGVTEMLEERFGMPLDEIVKEYRQPDKAKKSDKPKKADSDDDGDGDIDDMKF